MNKIKTEDLDIKVENSNESCQQNTATEQKFCCPYSDCGKAFKFYCDIKRHLCSHSNQRPYTCTYPGCAKAFKRPDTLNIHYKSHSITPSHICPFSDCGARYNTKAALKSHLHKHKKKKEVCCPEGLEKNFLVSKKTRNCDIKDLTKQDEKLENSEECCKKVKLEEDSASFSPAPLESVWDQEDQIRFLKCLKAVQKCESPNNCLPNRLQEKKASKKLALINLLKHLTQENKTLENKIKGVENLLEK